MSEAEKKEQTPSLPIEKILKKCMDCEGYVVFVGALTNKLDAKKNRIVEYEYLRHRFTYEDVKAGLKVFASEFAKDVTRGLELDGRKL